MSGNNYCSFNKQYFNDNQRNSCNLKSNTEWSENKCTADWTITYNYLQGTSDTTCVNGSTYQIMQCKTGYSRKKNWIFPNGDCK